MVAILDRPFVRSLIPVDQEGDLSIFFRFSPMSFDDYKIMRIRVNPVETIIQEFGGKELESEAEQRFKPYKRGKAGFETINRWNIAYRFLDRYGRDLSESRVIVEGDLFAKGLNGHLGPAIKVSFPIGSEYILPLRRELFRTIEKMLDEQNWHQYSFLDEIIS